MSDFRFLRIIDHTTNSGSVVQLGEWQGSCRTCGGPFTVTVPARLGTEFDKAKARSNTFLIRNCPAHRSKSGNRTPRKARRALAALTEWTGLTYRFVGVVSYKTKAGGVTELAVWKARCRACDDFFTVRVPSRLGFDFVQARGRTAAFKLVHCRDCRLDQDEIVERLHEARPEKVAKRRRARAADERGE